MQGSGEIRKICGYQVIDKESAAEKLLEMCSQLVWYGGKYCVYERDWVCQ